MSKYQLFFMIADGPKMFVLQVFHGTPLLSEDAGAMK